MFKANRRSLADLRQQHEREEWSDERIGDRESHLHPYWTGTKRDSSAVGAESL